MSFVTVQVVELSVSPYACIMKTCKSIKSVVMRKGGMLASRSEGHETSTNDNNDISTATREHRYYHYYRGRRAPLLSLLS